MESDHVSGLRALFSLKTHDAEAAIQALQTASRYDLALGGIGFIGRFGGLYPIYVRGEAYLAAHQPAEAAAQFQRILDHRSIVLVDPMDAIARLAKGRAPNASATAPPPDARAMEAMLREIGFRPRRWDMHMKLTQTAWRDWLRIPVLTDALLEEFSSAQRSAQIDEAFAGCDPASWRWEAWTGWTAWK